MAVFVSLDKKQHNKPHCCALSVPPEALHLKSVVCVPHSDVYSFIMFPLNDESRKKFRCYVSNDTEPTASFLFVSPLTLDLVRDHWQFFHHLAVTLSSFLYAWYHFWDAPLVAPVTGRLALSLFVLCTNTSILLSLISPHPSPLKEFYLNSAKMDPVLLTWLCICK